MSIVIADCSSLALLRGPEKTAAPHLFSSSRTPMNVVDVVAILPFFVARFGRAYLRWILSNGCCIECSIKMAIQTEPVGPFGKCETVRPLNV